jgi:hypothetical protein
MSTTGSISSLDLNHANLTLGQNNLVGWQKAYQDSVGRLRQQHVSTTVENSRLDKINKEQDARILDLQGKLAQANLDICKARLSAQNIVDVVDTAVVNGVPQVGALDSAVINGAPAVGVIDTDVSKVSPVVGALDSAVINGAPAVGVIDTDVSKVSSPKAVVHTGVAHSRTNCCRLVWFLVLCNLVCIAGATFIHIAELYEEPVFEEPRTPEPPPAEPASQHVSSAYEFVTIAAAGVAKTAVIGVGLLASLVPAMLFLT